jgi:SAM-dependent methyltransferase
MTLWLNRNGIACTTADLERTDTDMKIDIENTGIPEASYDVIIANHVLEHVDDFHKALKEMYRILRPKGCFICSFPMDPKVELLDEETEPLSPEERRLRFGQNDHKRVFGIKADRFLTEAGFEVEMIKGEYYPEEILPVIGPADYDMNILFCCWKPQ